MYTAAWKVILYESSAHAMNSTQQPLGCYKQKQLTIGFHYSASTFVWPSNSSWFVIRESK